MFFKDKNHYVLFYSTYDMMNFTNRYCFLQYATTLYTLKETAERSFCNRSLESKQFTVIDK